MISRRNFVTILLMMITIFFMFQFTQVIKLRTNDYNKNEYADSDNLLPDERGDDSDYYGYVVYFGSDANDKVKVIGEWSELTGRILRVKKDFSEADEEEIKNAELVFIDSCFYDCYAVKNDIHKVVSYGTPTVFLSLPDLEDLKKSEVLKKIYGVANVKADEVTVEGLEIFDDFLLGGEAAYKPQKEDEYKYMDLDLTFPWIETRAGTKTYAIGLMENLYDDANKYPKLMWRHNYENNYVFVYADDYVNENFGVGLLSATEYVLKDYYLYPVVNSQNFAVVDYPYLSYENNEAIRKRYSRDALSLSRDIIWPQFVSLSSRNGIKLTCFLNNGYEGSMGTPSNEYLEFYLQQINEINGEFGRSLSSDESKYAVDVKIAADNDFFDKKNGYVYSAAYIDGDENSQAAFFAKNGKMPKVNTVVGRFSGVDKHFDYLNDNVVMMGITNTVDEYSYSKELKHRCNLTALGYSMTLIDMHDLLFPENADDEWQNFSKELSGNIKTYWTCNKTFKYTSVSEGDKFVRQYLNLKYREERKDDCITIQTSKVPEAFYIFRTHNEEIDKIEGGEYEETEKGTYLIHAYEGNCMVYLVPSKDVFTYSGPFE